MTDDGSRMTPSQVHKFLRLTATDRRLLVTAVLLLGAVRLGLWLVPFQALRQLLAKMTRHATDATARLSSPKSDATDARRGMHPDRIVWAVVVGSRYVPKSTCLAQALAVQMLLARRGVPAHLHIGVAKQGQEKQLEAHAWVESQGKIVIGGSEPGRYIPLSGLERQSL
jgi:hypothetical protein